MKENKFNTILNILTIVIHFIIIRNIASSCWRDAMPGVNKFVTSSKLVALCGNNRFIAAAIVSVLMGLIYLAIRLIRKDDEGKEELKYELKVSAIMLVALVALGLIVVWPISVAY